MKKPRYMEELLKTIFLWLGVAFIFMGALCFAGVLTPKESSMVQDSTIMGMVFSSLGIVFFIVQAVLRMMVSTKNKTHSELLASGTKLTGTVEKVYLQSYTQYGRSSPYRVLYTYTYQGKVYHHKSHLLWDKPDLTEHGPITVYADDMGRSTIQL